MEDKYFSLETRLLAEWMHNNYQEISRDYGWKVQEKTDVEFDKLPTENRVTMLALAERTLKLLRTINPRD